MTTKTYLSNLSPAWPFERQEAVLDDKAPGWRAGSIYRDSLTPPERKAHNSGSLAEREKMLRPSRRAEKWPLLVASMAVLAWDGRDFQQTMAIAAERRALIRVAVTGEEIDPADFDAALAAFYAGRRQAAAEIMQRAGAQVSAARRRAATDERASRITRDMWGNPAHSLGELMKLTVDESGKPLSYNTLVSRLGPREKAVRNWLAAQKRKERRNGK